MRPDTNQQKQISQLKHDIQHAELEHAPPDADQARASALSLAMRIITDLIAAIVIGSGIGYLLDIWFDIAPLFLVLFFFLGLVAGIYNVIKTAYALNNNNSNKHPQQ